MRQHRAPGWPDLWSVGQHGCSYGLPLATRHTTELPSEGRREKGRVRHTDIKWFWCTTGGRSTGLMWLSSLHIWPSEADSTPQRPNLPDLTVHITHDRRCLQTSPARSQPLRSACTSQEYETWKTSSQGFVFICINIFIYVFCYTC